MIKKVLTYAVVITTMVWSVGLLATPIAVGAAVSGDLIKLQCATGAGVNDSCRAVYYLGADAKRYVFPNEKTYKTWYSDFSGVQTVSSTEMSSYSIGGNVTYRPGVKLVKITTDPKVYAVSANGTLRWVTTAAIAESLYGATWSTMVEDVPDAFFVNYIVGADVNAAGDYNKQTETTNASSINDDKNLGGGASTGTGLTVSLAVDTPASGLIVGNSINNKFTKVNLTASADGDIVIDQITVRRGGTIASDGAFSSIALIDATTDIRIGNTKTLNSEHMAVFNKDITVTAGTTKSIYLAGNMGSLASKGGEIPTLDLYSISLSGNATVIGTLPIVGNYQTLNATITIGGLSVSDGSNNPSASTQKVGTTNYVASGIKLVANSVEDFKVSQITFDQGGTAADADVGNFDLLIDDVVVATVASSVDGKVTFDLKSSPVLVAKGKTVQVDLQLDILSGSDRTIRFDVEDESDIRAVGQLYGSEVKVADGGNGATADAEPFWTAQIVTIDRGALRVGPSTLSTANIPEDVDQVVLGKFEFEAKGEAIEITSLPIAFTIATSTGNLNTDSTVDLTNVTVYDASGKIVAGPDDPTEKCLTGCTGTAGESLLVATSTDTITVPIGVNIYTVKADLDTDFGTNDTIVVRINPGNITAKGENTGLSLTPTPTSDQSSATMTVKSATLSLSTSPTPIAQTVVAGTKQHTFANLVLGAESSGEDVKVTKVMVAVKCNATCNPAEASNWSIYDGSTELSTTNDPDSQTSTKTTDGNDATSTFTFTTPLIITKGTAKTLTLKADIGTTATNGAMQVGTPDTTDGAHITAKGNNSGVSATITLSVSDGQNQTFTNTGTLEILQNGSTPDARYIPANSNGVTVAVLDAKARYEDVNIEKFYITGVAVNSGGWDQVDEVHIYKGSTLVKSVTPTSTDGTARTVLVDVTNDPIVVPKDSTITLTFKVDTPVLDYELNSNGSGVASSLEGIQLTLNAAGDVTAKGAQSGNSVATPTLSNAQGNNMYLVRSVPKITLNETGGTFAASTAPKDMHTFTVSADSSGDVGLFAVSYGVSTSSATITEAYLYESGTKVASFVSTSSPIMNNFTDGASPEWEGILTFVLTTDGAVPNNAFNPSRSPSNVLPTNAVIGAGSTRTYTLKGTIECANECLGASNTGTVVVRFLSDSAAVGTSPTTTKALYESGTTVNYNVSLLWTDFWRTPGGRSSTTATITEQWINGYLLKNSSGNYLETTSTGATWSKASQ